MTSDIYDAIEGLIQFLFNLDVIANDDYYSSERYTYEEYEAFLKRIQGDKLFVGKIMSERR